MPQVMTKSACGTRRIAEPFWVRLVFKIGIHIFEHNAWVGTLPDEHFVMMDCDFLDFKNVVIDFHERELGVLDSVDRTLMDQQGSCLLGAPFNNRPLPLYQEEVIPTPKVQLNALKSEIREKRGFGGGACSNLSVLQDPAYSQNVHHVPKTLGRVQGETHTAHRSSLQEYIRSSKRK